MFTVRRTNAQDAPVVARLVDALLAELLGAPSKLDECAAVAPGLLAMEDRVFGFLAYDGADPVGVMMVSESHAIYAGGAFGVITELYILPSHRSSGVAQRLINAGVTLGRDHGWGRLEVGAPQQPAWARSLQFYLRNGFIEVGPRLKLVL